MSIPEFAPGGVSLGVLFFFVNGRGDERG